jgi:delta24-sterol reductase
MDLSSALFRLREPRASDPNLSRVSRSAEHDRGPPQQATPGRRDLRTKLRELLIAQRWLIVVPVVLPLSKAYEGYWRLRHVYYRELRNVARLHEERVANVARQIRAWNARGRPGLLHTSRKSWQSVTVRAVDYKKGSQSGIDVELHDILELDRTRNVIKVEPRVNMAQVTRKLAPLGLTLPVVPELDDLTAGGLFLGYGIESASHKYGLFADTVRAAEVVLADGSVLRASAEEHVDLFRALPWSYGAHGMLTALELPVIPARPYVRLTYKGVNSLDEACREFTRLCTAQDPPEFLDALLFERGRGVLMYGDFADLPEGAKANHIGRFYKPWFYKHAEQLARAGEVSEYIPLRDYYHRYTRSLFWHGELLVPFGNHPVFRYLLGWLMPPKVSLMRLVQTEAVRKYRDERNAVQDLLTPLRHLRACLEMVHREFEVYPLWLSAHKVFRTQPQGMVAPSQVRSRAPARFFSARADEDALRLSARAPEGALRPTSAEDSEMFVDVGLWQVPGFVKRGEAWDGHAAVRNLEAWARAHGAYQCLYAVTEQSRQEFWRMFDRSLYARVRKAYGAEGAFMDVYDKVRRRDG